MDIELWLLNIFSWTNKTKKIEFKNKLIILI